MVCSYCLYCLLTMVKHCVVVLAALSIVEVAAMVTSGIHQESL